MPQAILRPAAEGFYTAWALTAGASKVAAVDTGDPVSHDDNTSYLTGTGGTFDHESFTLTAAPAGVLLINSVSIGQRSQVSALVGGPAGVVSIYRLGGIDLNISLVTAVAAWTTSAPVASPRPGGGAWTATDLATLEMGVFLSPGAGGSNGLCTSLWTVLDYGTAAGGFVFLLSQVAAFIGTGLTLAEMPSLNALLASRGLRLKKDEYRPAWEAWRAYSRPTFVLR